jgi:pimeloyl-ACP methyl ester carboxylesterase
MAPLLAAEAGLRGVIVWGGGAPTWFERQLGFERRALELGGAGGADIDTRMRALSGAYAHVLLDGLDPKEIGARHPDLAGAWETATGADATSQFGRPLAFHRQAQQQRWAEAWTKVGAPVLVLFGEYDWFEPVAGARLIETVVNRGLPEGSGARAELHVIPRMDHHFALYQSAVAAFAEQGGRPDARPALDVMLPWLKRHAE